MLSAYLLIARVCQVAYLIHSISQLMYYSQSQYLYFQILFFLKSVASSLLKVYEITA